MLKDLLKYADAGDRWEELGVKHISPDEAEDLILKLNHNMGGPEKFTWAAFIRDFEQKQLDTGFTIEDDGFDLKASLTERGFETDHDVIVVPESIFEDHFECLSIQTFSEFLQLLWNPSTDIVAFSENLDWILQVWHDDGRIAFLKI